MNLKHRWYEKIFFWLQMREGQCLRLIISLVLLIILSQILLTNLTIRKYLVLTEWYEGQSAKFYESFRTR